MARYGLKERRLFFFTCDKCRAPRRHSMFLAKAKDKICKKCLTGHVDKNQIPLFDSAIEAVKKAFTIQGK